MNMNEFFYFGSNLDNSALEAVPIEIRDAITTKNLLFGKYTGINFPVIFKQVGGKKLTDILDTQNVTLYLISEKLKRILEEGNFTGWKVYPIKLYDKKENEIKGYYGLSVTGVCGPESYKDSKIIEKRLPCGGPFCKFYKGVSIELEKWDGSDFFTPINTIEIITTKKVVDKLMVNEITNLKLTNLKEQETVDFLVDMLKKREMKK